LRGCTVTVRRVTDVAETQLFLSATPPAVEAAAGAQAQALYRALLDVLTDEGVTFGSVVRETVFFADIAADIDAVRASREAVLADAGLFSAYAEFPPATLEIEQPPLAPSHRLEVALQVSATARPDKPTETLTITPDCGCAECRSASAAAQVVDGELRLHAAAIYGSGATAYDQTHAMFRNAKALLAQAGMDFTDVVRTWIHLGEMDRDYPQLNRARREFFEAEGVSPSPASTGIGGGLASEAHTLSLGLFAVKSALNSPPTVMTTPTLNEAPQYGADFSRGMRIAQGTGAALIVSGTASLDETGATVHVGDTGAQIDRMLLNLKTLLGEQGADFRNVVSAITYLKHSSDVQLLNQKLERAGFSGFPNNLVQARVCRPDLLCEIELLALAGPA